MGGRISGFEWDNGNWPKCGKHGVSQAEIEQVMQNEPLIRPDRKGSTEVRFDAVGQTIEDRYVFVVFTLRQKDGLTLIRPLSARYMHKKEVKTYVGTKTT